MHKLTMRATVTEAEAGRLRQDLRRALATGRVRILGLPRRTRARWWLTRRIGHAAIWLVNHGHDRAAVLLWRVFRFW